MELVLQSTVASLASFRTPNYNSRKSVQPRKHNGLEGSTHSSFNLKVKQPMRKTCNICSAVPETAVSILVTAAVVGIAATLLAKRTETSEKTEAPTRTCDYCGGSGICPECKGEGFVLKKLSDESADRARMMAKNMATRYTAGLPKKWSYCTKCSSTRSCRSCDGTGKLSY